MQNPQFAVQEVHRVAAQGCRVALVRPIDAMGNYPLQPKYEPVWNALEETGMVYGMHPFPAGGALKPPGYTRAIFRRRADPPHHLGLRRAALVLDQRAELPVGSGALGNHRADDGLFRAASEAQGGGVRGVVDLAELPARRVRQGVPALSQRAQLPPLKRLPSETFFEHCMTGFEGDEAPPPRFPEFYGDILIWSSDVYHHDGDDAWRAMETMQKYELPVENQAKFLGANARRLYASSRPRRSSASASPRSSGPTGGRPRRR